MEPVVFRSLIQNASFLLALSVIFEVVYIILSRHRRIQPVINGVLIALICIAIMTMSYTLQPGLVFDTRSILISVTALIFGPIPAAITVAAAVVYRLIAGGIGVLPGLGVIISCALVGLGWRQWLYPKTKKGRWLNVFLMSMVAHLVMLACMLLLPYPDNINTIRAIWLPVLVIYPITATLLGLLLLRQLDTKRLQEELILSEERFRALFDQAPLGYQSLDLNGRFLHVNQQWLDMLGYTRDEVIGEWFGDFLQPDMVDEYRRMFSDFKAKGAADHELLMITKAGNPLHIHFIGRLRYDEKGKPLRTHSILQDVTQQKAAQEQAETSEGKYHQLFNTMTQGVVYHAANGKVISVNPAAERVLGIGFDRMLDETSEDHLRWIIREDGTKLKAEEYPSMVALRTGKPCGPMIVGVHQPETDDYIWLSVNATPLFRPGEKTPFQAYALFEDITAERNARQNYRTLFNKMMDGFAVHEIICDKQGNPVDYRFLAVNPAFEAMTGLKEEDIIGKTVTEVIPNVEPYWIEIYGNVALTGEPAQFENYSIGFGKYFAVSAYCPKPMQFACTFVDITQQKKATDQLIFAHNHDAMTGLINRQHFTREAERLNAPEQLPLSIILADINGLKLINDSFGFAQGDRIIVQTSAFLRRFCRDGDILARSGGDEFSILLPNTDFRKAMEILYNIQEACSEYNTQVSNASLHISLALGAGTKESIEDDWADANKQAESYLIQRKLLEQKSTQSSILATIKATMKEKSHETEAHEERMAEMARKVGLSMGLSEVDLNYMELLAELHDIGKVGISEHVLNKPGKLNDEEWAEMKKHPEIGERIAMSSSSLAPIANFILCHHERWDGRGYPQGLKGDQIPLLSRILSVVDAYDAMTQDRVYQKAVSHAEAIAEIKRCAGTQFDPDVARIFCEEVFSQGVPE